MRRIGGERDLPGAAPVAPPPARHGARAASVNASSASKDSVCATACFNSRAISNVRCWASSTLTRSSMAALEAWPSSAIRLSRLRRPRATPACAPAPAAGRGFLRMACRPLSAGHILRDRCRHDFPGSLQLRRPHSRRAHGCASRSRPLRSCVDAKRRNRSNPRRPSPIANSRRPRRGAPRPCASSNGAASFMRPRSA
jgi:hypothetical protein